MSRWRHTALAVFLAWLSGCAVIPPESSAPPIVQREPVPAPPTAEPEPVTAPERVAGSAPIVAQSASRGEPDGNPAIDSLLSSGNQSYTAGNYDAAIATAERALRIDRLDPRVYLLLARSYWAKGAYPQANQSARQGLQYSEEGSLIREQLERFR